MGRDEKKMKEDGGKRTNRGKNRERKSLLEKTNSWVSGVLTRNQQRRRDREDEQVREAPMSRPLPQIGQHSHAPTDRNQFRQAREGRRVFN